MVYKSAAKYAAKKIVSGGRVGGRKIARSKAVKKVYKKLFKVAIGYGLTADQFRRAVSRLSSASMPKNTTYRDVVARVLQLAAMDTMSSTVNKVRLKASTVPGASKGTGVSEGDQVGMVEFQYPIKMGRGASIQAASIHKTVIECGNQSTKSVNTVGKLNGTDTFTIYDSKWEDPGVADTDHSWGSRADLDNSCGFNSTNLWFPQGAFTVSGIDAVRMILSDYTNPSISKDSIRNWVQRSVASKYKQTVYASFKWFQTEMSLYNENSYTPINLKVHLIKPKNKLIRLNSTDWEQQLENLMAGTFNGGSSTSFVQNPVGIPNVYQHSSYTASNFVPAGGERAYHTVGYSVNVDNRLSLNDSAYFRENFEIVKTVSKKLDPNDTWQIKYKHHLGPGLNLTDLREGIIQANTPFPETVADIEIRTDIPLGYMLMVESRGIQGTGIVGRDSNALNSAETDYIPTTYQGTLPASYHAEFRTKMCWVKPGQNARFSGEDGEDQVVHERTYTVQENPYGLNRKTIFKLPADVVYSPDDLARGKVLVPIVTDKTISTVGPRDRNIT